jgi:hypothetical protein
MLSLGIGQPGVRTKIIFSVSLVEGWKPPRNLAFGQKKTQSLRNPRNAKNTNPPRSREREIPRENPKRNPTQLNVTTYKPTKMRHRESRIQTQHHKIRAIGTIRRSHRPINSCTGLPQNQLVSPGRGTFESPSTLQNKGDDEGGPSCSRQQGEQLEAS